MRLINADALKAEVRKSFPDLWDRFEINNIINSAPTETIYAHWIEDGHHIRCSNCEEWLCSSDREGHSIPRNFCPNCGATMEEYNETD